ncbi:MAG: hypothetical protein PHR66_01645 [Desulfuromonadaceae bacterium]|nr:hypothetical protein [Desulfuromonadaceae bacterium]
MKKSLSSSVIAALLLSTPLVAFAEPVTSKFNLSVGGFVKLDYAYNSENFGNSGGLTPGNGAIPLNSSVAGKQQQSIFTARQSRLWFKASGPDFMGAKTSSLIEADFYGDPAAAAESPQLRMRLAYGVLDWKNTQVLFGQNWDIFGPMVASTVDFRSGATTGAPNNPRVPQVRVTQKIDLSSDNSLSFVAGLQDPNQDGNNNNAASNYGAAVNAAGQIMFSSKALGAAPGYFGLPMKPLTVGLFGLYGNSKVTTATTNAAAANQTVDSYGYGLYAFVPVLRSSDGKSRAMTMSFEGQAYEAANMAFNTATAATVYDTHDTTPNAAKGYGLAAQLIFYPTQELGLTAGYGRRGAINQSEYRSYTAGTPAVDPGFQKSTTQFYANASYDLNAAVRVMAEYQNMKTDYAYTATATPDAKGIANIFRVAAFYFF